MASIFKILTSASWNYITVIAMLSVRTLKEDITALAEKGLQEMAPIAQVFNTNISIHTAISASNYSRF